MGFSEKDQEEVLKKETQAILDALTPEEQHKLKMIKENMEKKGITLGRGTYEHELSIKLAFAEACAMLTNIPCVAVSFGVASGVMSDPRFRTAARLASGIPTDETMTVPDPAAMKEATNRAADQIRERVLNNPVFEQYA